MRLAICFALIILANQDFAQVRALSDCEIQRQGPSPEWAKPKCNPDGSYKVYQCDPYSRTVCWCVYDNGQMIPGTSRKVNDPEQEKRDLADCEKARKIAPQAPPAAPAPSATLDPRLGYNLATVGIPDVPPQGSTLSPTQLQPCPQDCPAPCPLNCAPQQQDVVHVQMPPSVYMIPSPPPPPPASPCPQPCLPSFCPSSCPQTPLVSMSPMPQQQPMIQQQQPAIATAPYMQTAQPTIVQPPLAAQQPCPQSCTSNCPPGCRQEVIDPSTGIIHLQQRSQFYQQQQPQFYQQLQQPQFYQQQQQPQFYQQQQQFPFYQQQQQPQLYQQQQQFPFYQQQQNTHNYQQQQQPQYYQQQHHTNSYQQQPQYYQKQQHRYQQHHSYKQQQQHNQYSPYKQRYPQSHQTPQYRFPWKSKSRFAKNPSRQAEQDKKAEKVSFKSRLRHVTFDKGQYPKKARGFMPSNLFIRRGQKNLRNFWKPW